MYDGRLTAVPMVYVLLLLYVGLAVFQFLCQSVHFIRLLLQQDLHHHTTHV